MTSITLHRINGNLMGSRIDAVISLEARLGLEEKKYEDLKVETFTIKREKNKYRAYATYTANILNRDEYLISLNEMVEKVRYLPAWRRDGILAIEPGKNK